VSSALSDFLRKEIVMPKKSDVTPALLKAYAFHGVELDWENSSTQATGTCPWCAREGKFSVNLETGLWRCYVCDEGTDTGKSASGGGSYVFLRTLWQYSKDNLKAPEMAILMELAKERKLDHSTLIYWGVVPSFLTNDPLLPGYSNPETLSQLYQYAPPNREGKRILLATPAHSSQEGDVAHTLFGVNLYEEAKPNLYLCEGPWDAMALWEVLGKTKLNDEGQYVPTGNPAQSLLAGANVLAVPGCNTFKESWCRFFKGKNVYLCYDSDHPKLEKERDVGRQGYRGMQRVARMLLSDADKPEVVSYLHWGLEGYDPKQKSGYDVRDMLTGAKPGRERSAILHDLHEKLVPVPESWLDDLTQRPRSKAMIGTKACKTWKGLLNEWKKALQMRDSIADALATMLAVCLSTDQPGDQLFLQVIGDAGSAKTRLCDAILTSSHCHALEHLTGFYSGVKDDSGEDFSLIARINHKTLVTAEGDTVLSNPNFQEIMSQQRRIFDGVGHSTYKNQKVDNHYSGLRTPWIMAGTPMLLNMDQSRLGDRFLRIYINPPEEDDRQTLLKRCGYTSIRSLLMPPVTANDPQGTMDEYQKAAYQLTGGYIDHLRADPMEILHRVRFDEEWLVSRCVRLAEFTAFLRARPETRPDKEVEAMKEEPTRLTNQFTRLAICLAAVMNKWKLDESVVKIVRKVALDTARGRTFDLVKLLWTLGAQGAEYVYIANQLGIKNEKASDLLRFMKKIGAVTAKKLQLPQGCQGPPRWYLSNKMASLCHDILGKPPKALAACED